MKKLITIFFVIVLVSCNFKKIIIFDSKRNELDTNFTYFVLIELKPKVYYDLYMVFEINEIYKYQNFWAELTFEGNKKRVDTLNFVFKFDKNFSVFSNYYKMKYLLLDSLTSKDNGEKIKIKFRHLMRENKVKDIRRIYFEIKSYNYVSK